MRKDLCAEVRFWPNILPLTVIENDVTLHELMDNALAKYFGFLQAADVVRESQLASLLPAACNI